MPTNNSINEFADNLTQMGVDIVGYNARDREYLFEVAKLCAKQAVLPLGVAIGTATAGVGSVTLPIIGAVPGYVAGFLAGALGGTAVCTKSRMSLKGGLDELLKETNPSVKERVINYVN